jgi:hypothetical protein
MTRTLAPVDVLRRIADDISQTHPHAAISLLSIAWHLHLTEQRLDDIVGDASDAARSDAPNIITLKRFRSR